MFFNRTLIYSRDCPKYDSVLPNGMCLEYFQNQRIALKAELMQIQNDRMFGLYSVTFPFIKIWFTDGTPTISYLKEWLGK